MAGPITFPFHRAKALEATAQILRLAGGVLDVFNIVKCVYFADRMSLRKRGRPICGGRYVSMENGPVPKDVYVRVTSYGSDPWGEFFHREKNENWVRLLREVPPKHLSDAELEIIGEAYATYGIMPFSALWRTVHDPLVVPEHKLQVAGGEVEIPVEDILRAVGRDVESVREIARDDAAVESELPQVEV